MKIVIDANSGFCFGVINAIKVAEKLLAENEILYCLGDIVHNNEEVKRLAGLGLIVITHEEFKKLHDVKVLIRAHGEPPETYITAKENGIELIDATCRVVLRLQEDIKESFIASTPGREQILIFGKKGHAEVVGLVGQTAQTAIVISSVDDLKNVDFTRPAKLYSQTTQSLEDYLHIVGEIKNRYSRLGNENLFEYYNTICRRVISRSEQIQLFAAGFDKIVFVSGEKSSNGLYLFGLCKKINPNSFFISGVEDLKKIDISGEETIGICGATSTPMWLMEEVAQYLRNLAD